MWKRSRVTVILLLFLEVFSFSCYSSRPRTETLFIGENRFMVEIAETPDQIRKGLMFRQNIPVDEGMLFVFSESLHASFWMKNTFVSLDLLFMNDEGRIHCIFERTVPFSEKHLVCPYLSKAALELKGGTVQEMKIRKGDVVNHDIFHFHK